MANAEVVVLIISSSVELDLDLGIFVGSVRVVDEAVVGGIVEHQSERLIAILALSHPLNEFEVFRVRGRVAFTERVVLLELLDDLGEETLDGRVDTSKRALVHIEAELGDPERRRVTLEHVSVQVRLFSHI